MNKGLSILAAAAVAIACHGVSAADLPAEANWYGRSFFLLHLDHHTTDKMEVGRTSVSPSYQSRPRAVCRSACRSVQRPSSCNRRTWT